MTARTAMPRWPLVLIAAPAAVAVWSGWVGLGALCGFGVIHPLPGIIGGFSLNTAITLPVGVEAYGAYALGAWLAPGGVPQTARKFARRSAIGALALGMAGQVIYHLLAAAHATRAPWPVVVLVSCMPVVTLGFGAALTHLLRTDPEPVRAAWSMPVRDPGAQPRLRTAGEPGGETRTGENGDRVPVSRERIVAELAEEIRDAIEAGERWQPDYPALMQRTGFRTVVVREGRTGCPFGGGVPRRPYGCRRDRPGPYGAAPYGRRYRPASPCQRQRPVTTAQAPAGRATLQKPTRPGSHPKGEVFDHGRTVRCGQTPSSAISSWTIGPTTTR